MNNKTYTVGITGASGFLGGELIRHFTDKGWKVKALVRTVPKTTQKNVTYAAYDLTKEIAKGSLKGCDFVVHTAYIKQDSEHPDAMNQNVVAAKNILAAAKSADVKKLLFMSSMSAHEDALSVYGKQKYSIEELFKDSQNVVIRSGMIIGDGGIVQNMTNLMKKLHAVPLIGGGTQPIQIVGVYDLARVIEKLLVDTSLKGIYTIATPRVYSYKEFYSAIAKHLKIKIAFVPVPFGLLLVALKTISFLHLPLNIGAENLLGMKMLRSAETTKDLRTIGVELDELDAALSKTLR